MKAFIKVFALTITTLLLISQNSYSQDKKNDSINSKVLVEYSKAKAISDQQRTKDSLEKANLETQIANLKSTDNLKKAELLESLQALKARDSIRFATKKSQIDAMRKFAVSYPVEGFFGDTLYRIYSKLGSFSAHERAIAVSNKIIALGSNFNFTKDSLKIADGEMSIDIIYGDQIITSITENDAIWKNTTKEKLAVEYRNKIANAIVKYKSETSLVTLAKEIGLALLVLLVLGLIIHFTSKLFSYTAAKITDQEGKRIKGITIKNYTLFDARRQVHALLTVNTIAKWLVILLLIYIALPILFGIFPWTKDFAETLFGYILNPIKKMASGLWNYFPKLVTVIVIVTVFRYILRALNFFKNEIRRGNLKITGFFPDWANPTYQILRILVLAFMLVVVFPYLPGSDSEIFKGVSVFLGFLFTFGSAGSLSNVIAGLVLTYMRLFKIGDRVKIGDVTGDVVEKSLLVTRIKTIKNEIISVPNSAVMSGHTINYSSETLDSGLIVHTTVTIGYDVPWKKMHETLLAAADRTNLLLKNPTPFVLQTSLEDFYVAYQINAYTKNANQQANIYSELHSHIQDCCNEAGIEIMSPHYRAARDGNMSTIPEDYLPKDYKMPGFNVQNNSTYK